MDGSKFMPAMESSHATRLALTVDRDAVGLMRHASQLGHLAEWWLQGAAASMSPLAALRLGRKLERFRLAARLAEGKGSRQVQTTLETLRQEFALHDPPKEVLAELEHAARESNRLAAASKPPPTVYQQAFGAEPEAQDGASDGARGESRRGSRRRSRSAPPTSSSGSSASSAARRRLTANC